MGTKNNPGEFDCYANADPNEPMFVLLGRDPMAAYLVEQWADLREWTGETPDKVTEARKCAKEMRDWCANRGKMPIGDASEVVVDNTGQVYGKAVQ